MNATRVNPLIPVFLLCNFSTRETGKYPCYPGNGQKENAAADSEHPLTAPFDEVMRADGATPA